MNEKIIYSLNTEDVQTVALDQINRELTIDEIESVEDLIAKNIDWYSAIADAINEKLNITT